MACGLGRLRWEPESFWAATPRELAAAMRAWRPGEPQAATQRTALVALMTAFPDT